MKNILLAFIPLMVFVACSSKNTSDNQIDYKLDTLMVDSKGGIIMGATNLFLSDFDSNLSTLYNYSNQTAEVEVIDLDNLSIKHRTKIEQEGPGGVGSSIMRFYILGDSIFAFDNFFGLSFTDISGNKTKGLNFRNFEFFKELQEESDRFTNIFCFLDLPTRFLVPVYSWGNDFKYLAFVDLEVDQMEKIEIEDLKVINNFNITLKRGMSMRSIIQTVQLMKVNDVVYIANAANNDIFTFNIESQELKKLPIETDNLSAGKTGTYRKETDDIDEFDDIMKSLYFEIQYKDLVRNPVNGNFYRFSMQKIKEMTDELPAKFDIHLIAYDKDFQLLSETKIPEMNTVPQVHFWKDNALWMHENVEDELGFVRLKFLP